MHVNGLLVSPPPPPRLVQGPHRVPLNRFVTSVGTAKLILEEAARLLTLFWRVSPPPNGQCTLRCEQVGGDTWIPRLGVATGACVSVCSPGPCSWQMCRQFGEQVGGGVPCLLRVTCQALCWLLLVCSCPLPRHPAGSACGLDLTMSPLLARLCGGKSCLHLTHGAAEGLGARPDQGCRAGLGGASV